MDEELQQLITKLQEYNDLPDLGDYEFKYVSYNQKDAEHYPEEMRALLKDIGALADSVLITSDGTPDFGAILTLEKIGVKVTAGEQDSFGWLTGVIHTQHGKIVFG